MNTQVAEAAGAARGAPRTVANWHRRRIQLAALVGIALVVFLAAYGLDYYRLEAAQRAVSAKHSQLRPSGSVGHPLGILGGVLFVLMFLYPLRKRWPWLAKKGKTKHWLDFHILMGLLGPIIITFHSSFKLQGIAGVAYWIMMSVVLSGIVGRYFYGQIPRRLDAAEMSLAEMQEMSAQLSARLGSQDLLPPAELARLFRLPSASEVQSMPLPRALATMIALDLKRMLLLLRLRPPTRLADAGDHELREVLQLVRRQAALSKRILFLSKAQEVFHLWHVVHRPFSYSFALLSALHVLIVLLLGYF